MSDRRRVSAVAPIQRAAYFAAENLERRILFATITVTNPGDTIAVGDGVTLREAITAANTNAASGDASPGDAGADTITFNIPGGGVQTITPSELPFITDTVMIDGYTQPGSAPNTLASGANNAVINVRIDGSNVGAGSGTGLWLQSGAAGSVIRGLTITQFAAAIYVAPGNGTGNYVDDIVIAGNFIGTDGVADLGNAIGVRFDATGASRIGGTTPADRNVISGNTTNIILSSLRATVVGNLIGLNAAGTAVLQDQVTGIVAAGQLSNGNTIGGPTAAHRNVIAGHSDYGIDIGIDANNTRILGNYIGTDITGNVSAPNKVGIGLTGASTGIEIGGPAAGEGNVISGNSSNGISHLDGDARIRGNRIGTNAAGTAALGNGSYGIENDAGNATIGGADTGERNVISGNGLSGVLVDDTGDRSVRIYGNFIGTDFTGTLNLGNSSGIRIEEKSVVVGGSLPGQGNLISGNASYAVLATSSTRDVKIVGNRIGTDVTGKLPLANGEDGVIVNGDRNTVGGVNGGGGNVIAFNGGNGVSVRGVNNSILSNSIFSNVQLGIDLGVDGVTPNDPGDADTGANELINKPVLSTAFTNSTGVAITGFIQSKASESTDLTVQFFASPGADPSGFGEGKLLLGMITVITDGSGDDINFAVEFPNAIPAGQVITATTTHVFDGTSEFSNAVTVTGEPPRLSINDVTVTEGNGVPVSATFTISLAAAVSGPVKVDFATADGTALAPADYLSHTGSVTFNPGETTRTVTVTVNPDALAEGTETYAVNLSNAVGAQIAHGQGTGTVLDFNPPTPPPPPSFSINDVTQAEGNGPGATAFTFTITRGGDITVPASVQYATADGTAGAPGDYGVVALTTVNFAANDVSKQVTVNVVGDAAFEGNETFFVNLSNASAGAVIGDGQGLGTITNDDLAAPPMLATAMIGPDPANAYKQALIITGTDNGEYIDVDPGSSSSKLKVEVNDVVIGEFSTSAFDRIYVYAKGGDDRVAITTSTTKTAIVFGGEGQDQIKGGNGKDILLGEGGGDIIRGRKGRDIIIGGAGADGISGDEDDDLIIAAATTFDADLAAIFAFQKEWTSGNSYSTRRDNVRNGTGSNVGGRKINNTSILEDKALDLLSGNTGRDLFFYKKIGSATEVADKINDKASDETAVDAS